MVRTSPGVSGAGGAIGGASLMSMTSVGKRDSSSVKGKRLNVGRVTALPFILVHVGALISAARRNAAVESLSHLQCTQQNRPEADGCAHGCIPRGSPSR